MKPDVEMLFVAYRLASAVVGSGFFFGIAVLIGMPSNRALGIALVPGCGFPLLALAIRAFSWHFQ